MAAREIDTPTNTPTLDRICPIRKRRRNAETAAVSTLPREAFALVDDAVRLARDAVLPADELLELPPKRVRVVAEILSDGTVRELDRPEPPPTAGPWDSGSVAGDGWTVWWERRRWA